MIEQTEPTKLTADASPVGVALEDIAEAVSRGVARALAGQDDVSGYSLFGQGGPAVVGGSLVVVVFCRPPPKQGVRLDPLPNVRSQAHG